MDSFYVKQHVKLNKSPMAKYFYPEELQDFPKSKNTKPAKHRIGPSELTIKFIMGYGAALTVLKSKKIGNIKILMN